MSTKALASELLRMWNCVSRGNENAAFDLIEQMNLTITQMKALQMLANCQQELSLKEISERLGVSLPGISRTIDAMLKRGWVERREDDVDRRMKRVRITAEGRTLAQEILHARLAGLEDFADSLTLEQREQLYAVLVTIDTTTLVRT